MTKLVPVQLAAYAHTGGFPVSVLPTAVAIELAESGGDTSATHKNSNGTSDWGVFQINDIHKPSDAQKTDPLSNSQLAFSIYTAAGSKFTPWATYNSGSYKKHLSKATSAVATLQKEGPDYERAIVAQHSTGTPLLTHDNPLSSATGSIGDVANAVTGFSGTLTKIASNIGIIIVAVVMLVIGVLLLSRNTTAGKVAKSAVKLGAL